MLPSVQLLAEGVAGTNFVPKALRGKTYEVAACILSGRELGVGPMEALQKIHVVDGKPTLSAELMRSLVLRAGHVIEFRTLTDSKVVIAGRRAGSESWTEVTWTTADAARIGVGGKDVWKKYPRQMLAARATSELCRLIFPDALAGLSYTPEEIEDLDSPAPTTIARASSPGRGSATVRRTPKSEPTDEDSLDEAAADVEAEIVEAEVIETSSDVEGITDTQTKRLGALMREVGITGREGAIAYCVDVIRRPIESRNELTKEEASRVIDALQELVIESKRLSNEEMTED
jgi:hypothetical protein